MVYKWYREGIPEEKSQLQRPPESPIWWIAEYENGHTVKIKAKYWYEARAIAEKHGMPTGIRIAADD